MRTPLGRLPSCSLIHNGVVYVVEVSKTLKQVAVSRAPLYTLVRLPNARLDQVTGPSLPHPLSYENNTRQLM